MIPYNEYVNRKLKLHADGRKPCLACGQRRGIRHYGKWCSRCYVRISNLDHRGARMDTPEREATILRYQERAAKGLPLFERED